MSPKWIDFLSKIIDYCDNLEKTKDCDILFFRGHSKGNYELLPSLLRNRTDFDIEFLETALFYDFVSMAGENIKTRDSWDILFTMRHYGIPTRLLDWTTNFANALYFAVSSSKLDNPHIWILDPYQLSAKSPELPAGLLNPYYDLKENYVDLFVNRDQYPELVRPKFPIALYPPRNNPRIFAQQGVFTLHGTINNNLNSLVPNSAKKFIIPENCIEDARKFLVLSGIHEYSIYPDITGLANYLKNKYKIKS